MALFNRTKSFTVEELEGDIFEVRGVFIDSFHEMNLTLQVNHKTMEITAAEAEMIRVPHTDCFAAQPRVSNLVGLKIGPGARKAIQNAVGQAAGCTHLADLALDTVKAVIQGNFKLMLRDLPQDQQLNRKLAQMAGSCAHWSKVALDYPIKSEAGKNT